MAFKRSYSVYFQIIVVSIAFLLFVALVCGAAAIGFFSSNKKFLIIFLFLIIYSIKFIQHMILKRLQMVE
jgi:hypothetical protein